MATHAACRAGNDVLIFSKARKSFMRGAQYLHAPIPEASSSEPFRIDYKLQGPASGYRLKVYGDKWDGTVSPEDMTINHDAWDIREAYDWLWNVYGEFVQDWEASPATLSMLMNALKPDLTISSVPAPLLCAEGHTFRSAKIWSTDKAIVPVEDNTVICNGNAAPAWYRVSSIQGWQNTEWPDQVRPPIVPLWEVTKPLNHNCTCFQSVMRVGRYGSWTKGVLSHSAFFETEARLATMQEELGA